MKVTYTPGSSSLRQGFLSGVVETKPRPGTLMSDTKKYKKEMTTYDTLKSQVEEVMRQQTTNRADSEMMVPHTHQSTLIHQEEKIRRLEEIAKRQEINIRNLRMEKAKVQSALENEAENVKKLTFELSTITTVKEAIQVFDFCMPFPHLISRNQ